MEKILIALVLLAALPSAPSYAAGTDEATCRAAIGEKKVCAATRIGSPQFAACARAAIARCKAKGVGAL